MSGLAFVIIRLCKASLANLYVQPVKMRQITTGYKLAAPTIIKFGNSSRVLSASYTHALK